MGARTGFGKTVSTGINGTMLSGGGVQAGVVQPDNAMVINNITSNLRMKYYNFDKVSNTHWLTSSQWHTMRECLGWRKDFW